MTVATAPRVSGGEQEHGHLQEFRTDPIRLMQRVRDECGDVGLFQLAGKQAVRFEIRGMVKAHPAIVIEHVTRLREDLRPDWPQPAQPGGSYRVEIVGQPSYTVDIRPPAARAITTTPQSWPRRDGS